MNTELPGPQEPQKLQELQELTTGGDLTTMALPIVLIGSQYIFPSKKTTKSILNDIKNGNYKRVGKTYRRRYGGKQEDEDEENEENEDQSGGEGLLTDLALPTMLVAASHYVSKGKHPKKTRGKSYRKRYSRRRRQ